MPEIWDRSQALFKGHMTSSGVELLSPGRRTCEMLRPVKFLADFDDLKKCPAIQRVKFKNTFVLVLQDK